MKAKMHPGPSGFAVAQFGEEPSFESEIPNLVLLGESKAAVMKKPAAGPAGGGAAYKLEKYRGPGKVGVRRNFGDKKQIGQFGGKNWPFDDLVGVGEKVVGALADGTLEEEHVAARVALLLAKLCA